MTQTQTITLKATLDASPGGPKLLIKISDSHVNIEHLAEVSLVSDTCTRLTIVGLYSELDDAEVVISDRLAAAMEIAEGDKVMLTTSTLRKDKEETPPKPRAPVRHSPVVKPISMVTVDSSVTTLVSEEHRSIGTLLLDPVNVSQGMEPAVSRISLIRKIRTLIPSDVDPDDLADTEIGKTVRSLMDAWLVGDLTCRQLAVEVADLIDAKISCDLKSKTGETPLSTLVGGRPNLAVAEDLMKDVFVSKTREEILERAVYSLVPKFTTSTGHFLSDNNRFVHACNSNFRRLQARVSDEMRLEVVKAAVRLIGVPSISSRPDSRGGGLLTDREVVEELECDGENEVFGGNSMNVESLEGFNARMDVYLLRLLRLKASAVDQVANLEELGAYAVLGLNVGASEAEVRKAYKRLSLQLHPDRGGNTEMFQQLAEAYERVLSSLGVKKTVTQDDKPSRPSPKDEHSPSGRQSPDAPADEHKEADEDASSQDSGDGESGDKPDDEEELWEVVRGVVLAAQKAALMASEGLEMSQILSEMAFDKTEIRRNFQTCVIACSAAVQAVSLVGMGALEAAKLALEIQNFKNSECLETVTEVSELGVDAVNAALQCRKELEFAETEKRVAFGDSEVIVLKNIARRVSLCVGEAVRKALETAKVCEDLYKWRSKVSDRSEDKRRKNAVDQRRQNIELLRRLNSELLSFQDQITEAITKKHVSTTTVTVSEKTSVFLLLRDYLFQTCVKLAKTHFTTAADLVEALAHEPTFACLFMQKNTRLAVPISAAVRTLRLATVTDAEMTRRLVVSALVDPLKSSLVDRAEGRLFHDQVLRKFFN